METFSALLAICAGNSPIIGEFPAQRPVTRSFDVSFDLRLNKRLRKQSWRWWFETPSSPLWRHCNRRQCKRWDFIANPCPNFNGGLTKPSLKFEYGWIETSHPWDVIKWKRFPCFWPFVRAIHRSTVNSPLKGQWRGALMFPLIYAWINGCAKNHEAGDLSRHRAHYDVRDVPTSENSLCFRTANVVLFICKTQTK